MENGRQIFIFILHFSDAGLGLTRARSRASGVAYVRRDGGGPTRNEEARTTKGGLLPKSCFLARRADTPTSVPATISLEPPVREALSPDRHLPALANWLPFGLVLGPLKILDTILGSFEALDHVLIDLVHCRSSLYHVLVNDGLHRRRSLSHLLVCNRLHPIRSPWDRFPTARRCSHRGVVLGMIPTARQAEHPHGTYRTRRTHLSIVIAILLAQWATTVLES